MTRFETRREPVLDGVRGIAVLLVLFNHFTLYSGFASGESSRLDRFVDLLADSSWLGVDLFFVLSGFLITGILYDTKSDPRYFRTFYARRTLRIFPLYYGVLALVFLVGPILAGRVVLGEPEGGEIWYWAYLSNVDIALHGWQQPQALGHFWSLAVEEQFYLAWPLVVFVAGRRRLLRITSFCFLAAFVLRVGFVALDRSLAAYVLMPTRMDALAAGAFLALLVRGTTGWKVLGHWPLRIFVGTLSCLTIIAYWRQGLSSVDPVVVVFGYSLIATCGASLIATLVPSPRGSTAREIFAHPVLVTFGTLSYGLYVFHHIVVVVMRNRGFHADLFPRLMGSQIPGLLGFSAVALAASCTLAWWSWHLWEMPFLRLKGRFEYRRPPAASGRPASQGVDGPGGGVEAHGTASRDHP